MKKIYLLMLGAVMALSGCSDKDGTQYETWKPTFNLREYFTGASCRTAAAMSSAALI
jgi:hypothetical protein